jgi:ribose transport system substrate-binding protein
MNKARVVQAAAAALALLAAGCSSSSATSSGSGTTAAKSYTFDYANVADSSPLFDQVATMIGTDGKVVSIKVNGFDNNLDGPTALNNAHLMVQEKPNLIIDWSGVESIGQSLGAVFHRANIPCIAVNQTIPGCPFFNLENRYLGLDSAQIVVPILKQRGWTAQNTTLVLIDNPAAGAEVNSNCHYFYSYVAAGIPGMPQRTPTSITNSTTTIGSLPSAVQINGQDELDPSYTVMKQELQVLPPSRHLVIFTQNDDSALGAWRAITQAGLQKNTLIIGQGADSAGLSNLRTNPDWVAEGSVFFQLWPEYLLAMGVAVLNGAHPPALTLVPQTVLSKQTVARYYGNGDTPIVSPPLPAVDQYLVKTGILQKFHNVPGL